MPSTFEQFLGLEKHADADGTWGTGTRLNLDAIGYAPQEAYLFSTSIAENIGHG